MKKTKLKLFIKVFLLIIISFSMIVLIFNIAVDRYVEKQAKRIIENQAARLINLPQKEQGYYIYEFQNNESETGTLQYICLPELTLSEDTNSIVSTSMLVVNSFYHVNLEMSNDDILESNSIINYCRSHPEMLEEDRCRTAVIDNRTYYLMQIKKIIKMYNKIDNTLEEQSVIVILISDTENLMKFVDKINLIFCIILIIAGCLVCLAGYKIGVGIESDQQKLKYFFQNASHELKSPIMAIQGYAEGIETRVMKDYVKASNIILDESDRMSALVEEILFLSKLDSGRIKRAKEEVNICDLLYYCLNRIEPEAIKKNIRLEVDFEQSMPLCTGSEVQLEKVFSNLLSNAMRYTNHYIKVSCRVEKKYIKVIISDDGNGISERDFPHIFERFYKGKDGNNGIGLSIAKEIVKLHKGKISVINQQGANFIVQLKIQ